MVGAKHWPKLPHTVDATSDAPLIKVISEQIDPIGIGHIVEDIAIDVGDGNASGGFEHRTGSQVFTNIAAELEWDSIDRGELQVGYSAADLGSQGTRLRKALLINRD